MQEEIYWKRFVGCGKIEDYLKYSEAKKAREMSEGREHAIYNRGIGDTRVDNRRERPNYNTSYS